jgi:hypothetical protein
LFGPKLAASTRLRDDMWTYDEKLSDIDKAVMDKEFTEEEFKNAVDVMKKKQSCWS